MASKVEIHHEQLRGTAVQLDSLRGRMTTILSELEAALGARGAAWGYDSYGSNFADGDTGYTAAHANLKEGMDNVAKTFAAYSKGHRDSADLLWEREIRSAHRLRG
ncbi:hypothetical protein [Nocardia panacis]|uniref:hypothetical protein n=1 Tax=Nocardia panacis TaxID=2340916 RepID=UPI0011C36A37|nr:hypothetical protein [Nocardia panacis]